MIVIYYSHTGQTEKFVNKFFVDALKERFTSVTTIRVQADGPHTPITCKEINGVPVSDDEPILIDPSQSVIIVTPTYGRFDHKRGRTVDYTPRAIEQIIENLDLNPGQISYTIGGNRTFGADFARPSNALKHLTFLGAFELAGSEADAQRIAENAYWDHMCPHVTALLDL